MKKLNFAIALALGLIVPFGVMSSEDNEVNKYAMEMNEKSTEEVMKRVEMPEKASDKATEEGVFKHRYTEEAQGITQGKGKAYAGENIPGGKNAGTTPSQGAGKKLKKKLGSTTGDHTGQGTGESVGDLDRDRIRDQDKEQIHDMDQDREMDQDQDRSMEMDQDQLRDNDHVFDKVPPIKQGTDKK